MKIQFIMKTVNADGSTNESFGVVESKAKALETFQEYLENHGTGFNDFNEFHCRFVD